VLCTNRTNNPVVCTQLWAQVDATDGPVCARRRNGTIACAGYDYTSGNAASVAANATDIIDVATGQGNSCVVHADNRLTCYGSAGGSSIPPQTAAANNDPMQNFVDVEIGGYHLCALRTTGTLACYGSTDGNGATNVQAFDVSWTHVCVVHDDGTLQCFGTDNNGCVSGPNAQPGNPSDPNNRYIDVATGNGGTCALRENGTFICWGSATAAHVVDANANDEFDYISLSMGSAGTCGVHSDHTVTCWGTSAGVSEINALSATNVAQVSVADYGTCILGTDGSLQCYGTNTYGFQGLNTIGALP